jgi:hemoglobin-like flavoprotein
MNAEQIHLVQSTFALVRPISLAAGDLFYGRLFTLDPSLRPMFKGDMAHQSRMLMVMLDSAVTSLNDLDGLVPVVRQLGARHARYGVLKKHYDTVGSALLWTLEQGLGDAFKPAACEAWATAYELLASVMQMGAIEAQSRHVANSSDAVQSVQVQH